MINDKCIYCKKQNDFNREHAFPKSLLDGRLRGTKHEWIIDRHLCKKCNGDLGKLDAILTKRSPLAFIWDQIQNESGNSTQTLHSSIYRKRAAGIDPLSLFFPDPNYDNLIILHESTTVKSDTGVPVNSATALCPQIVLTKCTPGKSVEEVIAENCERFNATGLEADIITSSDQDGEVHCIFGNTYIFPPKTAEHFFHKIPEFRAKFMKGNPETRYCLMIIFPERESSQCAARKFYNSVAEGTKEITPAERIFNPPTIDQFVSIKADSKAMPEIWRAIAKVAFHSLLFHYPEFNGHEPMFNDIKEFIHTGTPNRFVFITSDFEIDYPVYNTNEHFHEIYFYRDHDNINIECQMELFTGLRSPPFSYGIILAGDPANPTIFPDRAYRIPFYLHTNSQMKRRIHLDDHRGIIHKPSPYEGVLRLPRYSF